MFSSHSSLILSLEAKLNLLHNYMNVTWIRIPSESRVSGHPFIRWQKFSWWQGHVHVFWGAFRATPWSSNTLDLIFHILL